MVDNSKNLFSKIINDFNPKDENQANDLKKILNSYPYFQSASAYYLKSLRARENEAYNELLPKTALLTSNRVILRDWLFKSIEIVISDNSKTEKCPFYPKWSNWAFFSLQMVIIQKIRKIYHTYHCANAP